MQLYLKTKYWKIIFVYVKIKKRRFTFITLGYEMRRGLFEEFQSSSLDDGMIIAKAASVILN